MRIMLDTNILISIAIFNSDTLMKMLNHICKNEQLILSTYILDELEYVILKKFPNHYKAMIDFLNRLNYEVYNSPNELGTISYGLRDPKDIPVLNSAIKSKVDIFISGDKDFEKIDFKKPKIMTSKEYVEKYIKK